MALPPSLLCSVSCAASDLPDTSSDLSVRALPSRPGWSHGCACSLLLRRSQTSPSLAGWSPSVLCNEAESGLRTLGSHLRRPGSSSPLLPGLSTLVTGLLSRRGCPRLEARGFMLKELLACLLPFKQVESPRPTWRDRRHGERSVAPGHFLFFCSPFLPLIDLRFRVG